MNKLLKLVIYITAALAAVFIAITISNITKDIKEQMNNSAANNLQTTLDILGNCIEKINTHETYNIISSAQLMESHNENPKELITSLEKSEFQYQYIYAEENEDMGITDSGKEQLIADINNGTTPISTYMRPGFEFLQTLIDNGYMDVKLDNTYEAFDEREAYMKQETAFVMAYNSAFMEKGDIGYGDADFNQVIVGFPTDLGQITLVNAGGYSVPKSVKNPENVKKAMNVLCSKEAVIAYVGAEGGFPARTDADVKMDSAFDSLAKNINDGDTVVGSNPAICVEQWGNTCNIVQKLFGGATVDECMAEFDRLQQKEIAESGNK